MSSLSSPSAYRRPLEGLRIVDFSRVLSGPLGTMILADLGAHVIRVEDLEGSDTTRHNPPFIEGESHYYISLNRNKESIAVDLKTAEGRKIAQDLSAGADVVIQNFRVGVAERLGLDFATLKARNPRLIYAGISGFGQTGPWKDRTAYDLVIQALTGALSVTGEAGRPPAKMGLPLADEMSALFCAIGILAALNKRDREGVGTELDVSMLDTGLSMLSYMANIYFATGESPGPQGSAHPTIYPYNAFQTATGYIVVAPFTNAFWRKFCNVIQRPELPENPRYRSFADRIANRAELAAIIDPILRGKPADHWLRELDIGDVPNGPVATVAEVLEAGHTQARGMVVEIEHARGGTLRTLGTPFHITYSDGGEFVPRYASPPLLGQQTNSILADLLGYASGEIEGLAERSVIGRSDLQSGTRAGEREPARPRQDGETPAELPLAGMKVLDLTRMLAGPYATLIMADLGAEVIKFEEPRIGDPTRRNIPMVGDESTYFMALNRGKKSITIDLKQPADRDLFLKFVAEADIVVENYRPGVMDRLGLSYDELRKVNPRVILCSISGYGQTGPLRDKISFDLVNQAMAGTMAITGEEGRPPVRIGLPAGDLAGGIFGALGSLAALHARRRTGLGAHVEVGLHDLLVSLLGYVAQLYFTTGETPGPVGSGHHHIAPYRVFAASDGDFVVAAFTNAFWHKLVKAIGMPELAQRPEFVDLAARKDHKEQLNAILEPVFRQRTVAEWLAALAEADVPSAPVYSVGQALESEQAAARECVFEVEHPALGPIKMVGTPFRGDGRPWRTTAPPPLLGEHSEILRRRFD